MKTRRTRTRWGACIAAVLGAILFATVASFWLDPWPCDRADPPVIARRMAISAIEDARAASASTWAPQSLQQAEDSLRIALEEDRIQEVRFRPLRDYRGVRRRFAEAFHLAVAARDEAVLVAGETEADATRAIADASTIVFQAEHSAGLARLKAGARKDLEVARQAMAEARLLLAERRFIEARGRAEDAIRSARKVLEAVMTHAGRYGDERQRRAWRQMVVQTVTWSAQTGRPAIVVNKEGHAVTLYRGGLPLRVFRADIGRERVSDKRHAGDAATPEGHYRVIQKKGPRETKYYKALLLDYPNEEDRRRFEIRKKRGMLPKNAKPGGLIEIHGHGGQGRDWTDGCVALSNADMDVLFDLVPEGTPVTIVGSDGGPGPLSDMVRSLRGDLQEKGRP